MNKLLSLNKTGPKTKDLSGTRFNRLTVTRLVSANMKRARREYRYLCICDCGNEFETTAAALKLGVSKSCGCLKGELITQKKLRHAASGTLSYKVWGAIKRRCFNYKDAAYERYGGRGITMCKRWSESYEAFIEDMGHRPSANHSIDRIDNEGNYEPGNCRWATSKEQGRNTRRTIFITIGERKSLAEWCEVYGIKSATVRSRIKKGWPAERAVTTPLVK